MENREIDFLCEAIRFFNSIKKYGNWELMKAVEIVKYKKMTSAINRMEKKIESFQNYLDIELLDFTGRKYEIELPIEALNIEDYNSDDDLIISDMIEPVIKRKNSSDIIRVGKVLLSKNEGRLP